MLDHFTILTQSGLVLWSRSWNPSPSPIDSLIRSALIEERSITSSSSTSSSSVSKWDKDGYTLLWLLSNEYDLIFVVAYQRILRLGYVEELLGQVEKAFVRKYEEEVRGIVGSTKGKEVEVREGGRGWPVFQDWDKLFDGILKSCEASGKLKEPRGKALPKSSTGIVEAGQEAVSESATPTTDASETLLDPQTIVQNIAALKARQKAGLVKKGKAGTKLAVPSGSEADGSESDAKRKSPAKVATKWSDSKVSSADLASYDYSSDIPASSSSSSPSTSTANLVSSAALGTRDKKSGLYEVADYFVGSSKKQEEEDATTTSTSVFSSLLSKLSLSPKVLTSADLAPALAAMREHLMSKNVAQDIADKVCSGVGKSLEGRKVGGFGSVRVEVRKALELSLVKILTPKTSTDLLLEITRKKSLALSSTTAGKATTIAPYCITFVGVNGVGKSTNLSKVAFWLLQNKLRVLIGACDTFRSGAVEQLRVHVKNLGRLGEEMGGLGVKDEAGKARVELFERGYGKDAAGIAKDAIAYAKEHGFDVVLIDTAGRMQDNEPLMRALAKLVTVNNPDKIVFVGEALVGNEAVDQLTKFNRSLRDFSGVNNPRGIDGMILTKFDTIDDKVGAALSMTYVTSQPILFVGTGQTYTDLKSLRVAHIVGALLQD